MKSIEQIIWEDAEGYGTPIALFRGLQLVRGSVSNGLKSPVEIRKQDVECFIQSVCCLTLTRAIENAWRLHDFRNEGEAALAMKKRRERSSHLGQFARARERSLSHSSWFSPRPPGPDYRNLVGLTMEFTRGDLIRHVGIPGGTLLYVGRAGPMFDAFVGRKRLGGGVQFWIPEDQWGRLKNTPPATDTHHLSS